MSEDRNNPPAAESIPTEQYRDNPPDVVRVDWGDDECTHLWAWKSLGFLCQYIDGWDKPREYEGTLAAYRRQPDDTARLYWSRARGYVGEPADLRDDVKREAPKPKNTGRWRSDDGKAVDFDANTFRLKDGTVIPLVDGWHTVDMDRRFGWTRIPDEQPDLPRAVLYKGQPFVLSESGEYQRLFSGSVDDRVLLKRQALKNATPIEPLDSDNPQEWVLPPDMQPCPAPRKWAIYKKGQLDAEYERITVCGVDLMRRTWLRGEEESPGQSPMPEQKDRAGERPAPTCPECSGRLSTGMGPCSICTPALEPEPIEPILRQCPWTGRLSLRLEVLSPEREVAVSQLGRARVLLAPRGITEGETAGIASLYCSLRDTEKAVRQHYPRTRHIEAVEQAFREYVQSQGEGQ